MSSLRSAFGWGSAQAAVRLVVGFASIKVTAVILGPAGIALVGQVGNFLTLLQGTLGNAIQTAVTKMTAEREGAAVSSHVPLWGTSVRLALGLAAVVGAGVALLSHPLAAWLFGRVDLWPVVVLVGLILPFTMLQVVLMGILTGLKKFRPIAVGNILTTVLGAVIFIGLSYFFGLTGGLAGTILAVGGGLIVLLAIMRGIPEVQLSQCFTHWRRDLLPSIFSFYPMLLVHAAANPLTLLLMRDALIGATGADQAGLWQATMRLSNMYTLVLVTTLSMYSLPTLSAITDPGKFRQVMFGMSLKMGGATAAAALAIYLCRDLIVRLVFTSAFLPVRELLGVQLIGDILSLAAWPLHSALMAQNRSKTYMTVEVGVAVGQIALTYLLLPRLGVAAAPGAYTATWGAVLVVLVALHWRLRARVPAMA